MPDATATCTLERAVELLAAEAERNRLRVRVAELEARPAVNQGVSAEVSVNDLSPLLQRVYHAVGRGTVTETGVAMEAGMDTTRCREALGALRRLGLAEEVERRCWRRVR